MRRKKNLEKAIVMGLLLSTSVYGTAWAEFIIEDNTLIGEGSPITDYDPNKFDGKALSSFDKIIINVNGQSGLKTWSGRYNLETVDLEINVTGNVENSDGVHLTNHGPNLIVNNYKAYIDSPTSDALNLSHDSHDAPEGPGYAIIKGDLTAIVEHGNGIRANASLENANINTITVIGDTNITINSDKITVKRDDINYNGITGSAEASYNPAAVYAGDDLYNFNYLFNFGGETKGQGIVNLNGTTTITTNGDENYGIYAGKNGTINVNDVTIEANGKNSVGIAAKNGNLIYDENMTINVKDAPIFGDIQLDVEQNLDTSENRFGSIVTMNGDKNIITMADGGKALFADGKYSTENDKEVIIKSGDNGIGNLTAVGDIVADNGGKIDLDIRDWADITGNIEATNSATVDLSIKENTAGISLMSNTPKAINITGDIQAANGATINLTIGDNAKLTGRIDDYKDADNKESWANLGHDSLFDEDFAKEVDSSGKVNLTLGNNSEWFVTEQSWATSVKTAEGAQSTIDLTKGQNSNYAVHIGDLDGSATFVVNLDPNIENAVNNGNMIYVYDGTGANDLNLRIANETEVLSGLQNGEKLRFATVASAGHGFGDEYIVRDRGVINSGFRIEYENYDENATEENNKYNGGEFSENKPGNDYVTDLYKDGENVYIVRDTSKDAGLSDAGKTIINMSRANYKNAIYMDRLNKRLGEARYINGEEEQGMWVRLRHDRIGQSGDFRSMNTMYELGYDVKQDCDNGERRIGMAIDYMRGSTSYSDIAGKGETKRYGLWLYDTWLGDKGHYVDYVAKWGHLDNDFDIYTMTGGEKVNGDYSNNVFSVSAEYGKKNDMGNNWYFEPQAQLQLARVTGADYVSSQNTKVSVDGINSLIGRAGFRLGRDLNENSTVYVKADLLHEFLGDQTITATDATGTFRDTFENKGTWYDVGFGFATALGNNSYAFMDFEKSFGNDNDETYQINAGVQWTF